MTGATPARVRIGAFELDLTAGELHKGGRKVRLQEQPFQILQMLVERAGEVVTREDIQAKLWPNDTVVEFDHGINTAIRKLRGALEDSAEEPQYVETVARRGYRLIMPVEWQQSSSDGGIAFGRAVPGGEAGAAVKTQPSTMPVPGKTVSHYRVLNVIGGGGMGVVYRAEDLKLGRQVALKFLPEEVGGDPVAVQRFEREARTASSLNHPNICTIYEVEEHEGTPFIVMEYLEGMTLRELIGQANVGSPLDKSRKNSLAIDEILDLSIQIADGLEAAHQKGIIHRDIKPANIFVTRQRQVKILDFGLAKLVTTTRDIGSDHLTRDGRDLEPPATQEQRGPEPESNLTRAGASIGTTGYMSPEQVQGLKLDARTDLFCCGLVIYELATGRRAFGAGTKESFREAVLHQSPTPAPELNPLVPPKLVAIIDRCLEKARNQRYQHASNLRDDLKQIRREMSALQPQEEVKRRIDEANEAQKQTPPPPPDLPKEKLQAKPPGGSKWITAAVIVAVAIAVGVAVDYFWRTPKVEANAGIVVLPFADKSLNHDDEYFSDGLTEQLINDLARIPGLKVIARSSAFQFKGKDVDPRAVGRALNVANILEGSVWKEGDRVRITVELTKASDGFQLWSHSYDRQVGDIFAVQDEIARAVASELQVKLTGASGAPLARNDATTTPEAYEAYLQGRYYSRRRQPGDYNKAMALADQAIRLDPRYAPAWALRSYIFSALSVRGDIDNSDGFLKAQENAQAAIALDPALADAYLQLVLIQVFHEFDLAGAEINLNKAAELEPGNADVYAARSIIAEARGNLSDALEFDNKLIAVDPLRGYDYLGATLYHQGKYDEALPALEKGRRGGHFYRGAILLAQGHPDQALAEMALETEEPMRLLGQTMAQYALGHHRDSDNALDELIGKHGKDSAYQVGEAYAFRNQLDKAFEWLERAYAQRDGALINLKVDPLLKNLRQDPRYAELLRKMNL